MFLFILTSISWVPHVVLQYQFSIRLNHNSRVRVLVFNSAFHKLRGLLKNVPLITNPQEVENTEGQKQKFASLFHSSQRQENGKAQRMHLFSDSGGRQEGTARQGDQFSPQWACVVSPAKCRKIVRVEGWNSCILLSKRGLDGRMAAALVW